MKIIAFGDIHEKTDNLDFIAEEVSSADAIIITGDLTQFGGISEAEKVISKVSALNRTYFAQAGNLDAPEVEKYLLSLGISLHASGRMLGEIGLFGCGGSNPSPFNTPNEFSEEEIAIYLSQGHEKIESAKYKVLIPHMPPFDTKVDVVQSGIHVGSKSVRNFIEEYQPDLCITGHIHEAAGEDYIGKTRILNPGPFSDGGWINISFEDNCLNAELRFLS